MNQRKFRIITGLISLLFATVCFLNNGLTVSATSTSDSLHTQTKIYSSNNDDYFDGCEDYNDYVDSSPTITVLTHGLGASDFHWSNNYNVNGGEKLAYNSSSLINKIYEKLDGQMTLYVAKGKTIGSTYDFELIKYSHEDYVNATGGKRTSVLDDVSKHIVIVFDSSVADKSNYTVYDEFHNILDNISAQYKNLTGVLPRFNLVGHSRGGITNIMYATEHPYNVASIFSMGTPYSGSVLGELEILLAMMGYADGETYEVTNAGVNSIMDEEELQDIRDAWNSACTADVKMNVVAYGSMTSIHLLDALIEDMDVNYEKYEEEYGTVVKDYSDYFKTAVNIIDDNPDLTSSTLEFIDGLAKVLDDFGVNLFDALFKPYINSNLEGKITNEEVSTVLGLVNVINDEVVIMDDLFIDLNSQLGYGFEDGISYNGFKRYTKIFGAADYTDNRAISGLPGIVHNLETMNETYTNNIANSLDFGIPESTIVELSDDFSGSYSVNLGRAFSFTPTYTGVRKFTASGCTIKLYQYDTNNCLQLIESVTNSLTYEYDRNTQYLLIVEANSTNTIGVSFSLEEKMELGENTVEIGANDKRVYKLTASTSGYYLVSVNNTEVSLSVATCITTGKYYIHLEANTSEYLYLENSSAYSTTVNVEIYEPSEIDLNQETQITNSNQKVMKFTNPYNSSMAYILDISWTSGTKYATVYNSNGSTIGAITTSGTKETHSFTLSAGETCYVIYSSTDSSITSNLYINPTQLRWKVAGEICDTNYIQLPRGDLYTIELVVLNNGTVVDCTSQYVTTSNTNFDFSNNTLIIYEDAEIKYEILIFPTLAPDYLLTIKIGCKKQDHLYTDRYVQTSVAQHTAYCYCGESVIESHNIVNDQCDKCGMTHTHIYTNNYEEYSSSQHKAYCWCGEFELQNHDIQEDSCTICGVHIHSYTDHYEQSTGSSHEAYCWCGEYITESHQYVDGVCTLCGEAHEHLYRYRWLSDTTHKEVCLCGEEGDIKPHVVETGAFTGGAMYATCLLCGGRVSRAPQIILSVNQLPHTDNGSYITPDGIIVLADEDVEAYFDGTLEFIYPDDNLETE